MNNDYLVPRQVANHLCCLPGRVAVLVREANVSVLAIPEAVRERWLAMERPPHRLINGIVVGVGPPRGSVPMPSVGDLVWALPRPGLIIVPDDIDIPSVGRHVPDGHTLRIYGVGDPWHEQILGYVAGSANLDEEAVGVPSFGAETEVNQPKAERSRVGDEALC